MCTVRCVVDNDARRHADAASDASNSGLKHVSDSWHQLSAGRSRSNSGGGGPGTESRHCPAGYDSALSAATGAPIRAVVAPSRRLQHPRSWPDARRWSVSHRAGGGCPRTGWGATPRCLPGWCGGAHVPPPYPPTLPPVASLAGRRRPLRRRSPRRAAARALALAPPTRSGHGPRREGRGGDAPPPVG